MTAEKIAMAGIVLIAGFFLAAVKVKNELEMTRQYARWADASVRQAEALDRLADKFAGKAIEVKDISCVQN